MSMLYFGNKPIGAISDGGSSYTEGDGIDITNNEISVDTTFTEASTRANITSDENFATILGKIKKFFTDLKTVAFSGAAADVTYDSGTVEDALDSLTASMAKTFVELGDQNDIGGAWDALTVYDRPVLCAWTKNGRHWGLLYKYTGGQFGMGISQAYYSTVINVLSVSGGTKTIKALTAQ